MTKREVPIISNKKKCYLESPVGVLEITEDESGICGLSFCSMENGELSVTEDGIPVEETALLAEAKRQLQEYFEGKRRKFELPLSLYGTEFQKKDWQALLQISYGETRSYGEIARAIGCPRGSRAVGMANRSNPIAIIVPCHRIVGSDGSLTGYAAGVERKRWLLELEGAFPPALCR